MILPPLKQVWLLKNWYYSVNTAKPPFAAGNIVMLKETYGKEGQVFGSSRSRMYTVRWICMWNNIHNLRSCTGEYFQRPKRLHTLDESVQLSNPALIARGSHTVPLRGGGGRGVSYPGPRGKRGAPRSLRKNLFDNFSILTANVNPFHVSC